MRVALEPAGSGPMLEDLLDHDSVKVETVPEKKGILFLKHVEYKLVSPHFMLPVARRFSDFAVFHALLLQRFIYRMVPPMPPKRALKGVLNHRSEHFIENRRRGLQRFMTLVMRHPIISGDELVKVFMTANSAEVQVKMRETIKRIGDEYITCPMSAIAKRFMPDDIQTQTEVNREFICSMLSSIHKLRDVTERMSQRSRENSTDLLAFGKDLRALGSEKAQPPQVATAAPSWQNHRQSIHGLSEDFRILADKAALQGAKEENEVVERLSLFLDLLQSYKDLCDRHESGIFMEHQRAQQRRPEPLTELLEQPESRLAQQENAIVTMELRSYFSLFCLHQETQLVFTHLPLTTNILGAFIQSQIQGHKEMGDFWCDLLPKLNTIFEGNTGISSPPRSPCRRIIFP
ncbi:sorting nexin-8 [Alosa pseudoharengus]|uniref:sorting nexin-8 n=1 Tax=Alosa pseudoharengus TaxID=34774 RepID=UPI003F8AC939